jgi:hypothetical protein
MYNIYEETYKFYTFITMYDFHTNLFQRAKGSVLLEIFIII